MRCPDRHLGHRYGWVPSKAEGGDGFKSITWWEVEWALEAGKPVYAFLLDDQAKWEGEREQDRILSARTNDEFIEIGRPVCRLRDFRAFLEKGQTRDTFLSAEDLGGKVATSLHPWLLQQAVVATRAAVPADATTPLAKITTANIHRELFDEPRTLYWQEQIHLLSGQRSPAKAKVCSLRSSADE